MGEVVARGKIKVDARKALHKLRDHMLVDLHLWSTEIARVAMALGATFLHVDWDADDVVLTFDGRAMDPAEVASARDHVLSPREHGTSDDKDALRLLGIGVTAALGLGPSFVDVYASGERVRFESSYIDDETSPPPVPADAGNDGPKDGGTRVHVRRRLGIDVLGRAMTRDAPRELAVLLAATVDAPLAVRGKGVDHAVAAAGRPKAILRVDLDVPEASAAMLEVLEPTPGWRAERVFLERGVRLASYAGIDAWGLDGEALPLRVVVDARRLPTNASRSELRMDSDLVKRVKDRIPRALAVAVEVLRDGPSAQRLQEKGAGTKLGHALDLREAFPRRRLDALGAIAAVAALTARPGGEIADEARALLDLPLMHDAVGGPLTLNDVLVKMTRPPVLVYRGRKPEDPMLAPWLSGLPWVRGAPAERVLEAEPMMAADAVVAEARAGGARRARALAHPPSRPVLVRTPDQILVEGFAVREGRFAGLEGEVAISKTVGAFRRRANVHVFVEERLLEVIALPGTTMPVEIALAWPERLRPRKAYDGVERNDAIDEAIHYALRVAAVAIGERLSQRDPELARLALAAWLAATARLKDVTPSISVLGKLADEAAWPTTEPGTHVSLVALESYVRRTGALCIGPAGTGRAADGRPVLDEDFVGMVRGVLPEKITVVPYGRALSVDPSAPLDWIGRAAASMLAHVQVTRPHVAGVLGVAGGQDARRVRIFHRGVLVRDRPKAGGASLVVEDFAAVPNETYTAAIHLTPIADMTREERALLEIVVERCEKGELDPSLVESYLQDCAEDTEERDPALHARIVELPKAAKRVRAAMRKAELSMQPLDTTVRPGGPSGSVTTMGVGSVTAIVPAIAVLDTWSAPPAVVLYSGRVLTTIPVTLPVVAFVDLLRLEHVGEDWASLSESGREWADNAIEIAACELIKSAAMRADFANDVGLLKLAAELLDAAPTIASRIDHALRKVKWPTVQGGTWTLGDGSGGGSGNAPVHTGRRAYASWLADASPPPSASPFDAPAVCLPQGLAGDLRARILRALGCGLVDMTETLARVQEQRARWAKNPPPRLAGTPELPRLRSTLAALGATAADGELEIVLAAKPDVSRVVDGGDASPFEVPTPLPIRAVFRCAEADIARAAQEIADAADKHVRALARTLADPPPAVRAAARALLCAAVARSGDAGDLERLDVFPDTTGEHRLSLADMRNAERTRVVTDPPPHPAIDDEPPVIFLSPAEKEALARVLRLVDVTESLREIVLGEQRRRAPPLSEIALDDDTRRACLFVARIDVGPLSGEVGLLRPAHVGLRGIRLHHTRRPLVTLPDDIGWPMIAVVNDDSVAPTRAFTGLASRDDAARIRNDLRAAILPRVSQLFEVPADAMGAIRLPFPFYAQPGRVPCIGALWIERTWPERPEVHVEASGHVDPFHVPRTVPGATPGAISDIVPVRGKVLVAGTPGEREDALRDVFKHAQKRLGSIIAAAKRSPDPPSAEALASYEWELRMLGERTDRDPRAELASDRPDEILLHVVARRAPSFLQLVETPPPSAPAPAPAPAAGEPSAPDARVEELDFAPASSPPSFFEGLVRRIVDLVSGPAPTNDPALTSALSDAVLAMRLTGSPVAAVVEARRGRPIRFDAKSKVLVVNTKHAAVVALANHPARTLLLLAAAVSEVNRELEQVTDAEELNVIVDLLRG